MRNKMAFINGLVAVGLLASLLVVSGGVVSAKSTPAAKSYTVTLDGWASTPSEPTALQQVINKFEKKYPNIHVKYNVINGDFQTAMTAAFAGGTAPDVLYADEGWAQQFERAGEFQNLNGFISKDSSFDIGDFYPGLLQGFKVGKSLYGIPKDYSTLALYYNPTMLKAAKIKSPPKTWAQFQTDACAIRKYEKNHGHPNVYGAGIPNDQARWQPILQSMGGAVMNKGETKAEINSKAGVSAINYFGHLTAIGCSAEPSQVGTGWSGEEFGKGYAAMVLEGPWLLNPMATSWPNTPYKLATLPSGPKGGGNLAFSVAYAMNAHSKVKPQAWTLISYLTGKVGEAQWVKLFGVLPARKSLKPPKGDGAFVKGAASAESWSFKPGYFNAGGPYSTLNNDLDKVAKGQMTAKAAALDTSNAITLWLKNG